MSVSRSVSGRSDAELLAAARDGSSDAFFEVWSRHAEFAQRYASTVTRNVHDRDDLVAEVRDRVWSAVANGKGPTIGVRSYIATALRNRAASNSKTPATVHLDEVGEIPSASTEIPDLVADETIMNEALRSLPERTREIILLTQVSQVSTEQLAVHFGTTRNNASQMARRALDRLRNAWIDAHMAVDSGGGPDCATCRTHIRRLVAGDASPEESAAVHAHIDGDDGCERCAAAYAGAMDSGRYRALLIPLFLGTGATAEWLAAPGSTGAGVRHGLSGRLVLLATAGVLGVLVAVAIVVSAFGTAGTDDAPDTLEEVAGTDHERVVDNDDDPVTSPTAPAETPAPDVDDDGWNVPVVDGPSAEPPVAPDDPDQPEVAEPGVPETPATTPTTTAPPRPEPGGSGSFARTETFTGRWDMVMASATYAVGSTTECASTVEGSATVHVTYPVERPTSTRNILTWTGSGTPDTDIVVNGHAVSAAIVDTTGTYEVNGVAIDFWQATAELPRPVGDVYVVEGLATEMSDGQCAMGAVVANVSVLSLFEHPSLPDRIVTMASGLVPLHSSIATDATTTPSPTGRVVEVYASVLEGDEFGAGESVSLGSSRLDDGTGVWGPTAVGQASTARWTIAPSTPADVRLTSADDHVLATVVIVVSERGS